MNEHPSFLVYQLLGRFFESRGLTPVKADALALDKYKFTSELEHVGYFRVDAEGDDQKVVAVILLALQGKYTEHGPQLRGLITTLNSEGFAREGRLGEVIVIAPEDIMRKKNMTDVVDTFRAAAADTLYNMYPYHVFSLDIPRAQIVPKHEVISEAEAKAFLTRERLGLADLKRIPVSNPPVVWIGARPGQVVRITAPSEATRETYDYRVVTRG